MSTRREALVLREWLEAIRLEVDARGENASLETIRMFADQALRHQVPHWYTDEYRAKRGHLDLER